MDNIKIRYYHCLSCLFKNKITKVYLIRTADVENPEKIIYGRKNGFNLSLNGANQVKNLSIELYNELVKIKNILIVSSPLERAQQTANIIYNKLKTNIIVETLVENELIEINNKYEGESFESMANNNWKIFDEKLDNCNDEYETYMDIYNRINNCIQRLIKNTKANNIILVTHGELIMCMRCLALKKPITLESRNDLQIDGFFPHPCSKTILFFNKKGEIIYSKFY
jgi:broad specificity phosphatase PhoE